MAQKPRKPGNPKLGEMAKRRAAMAKEMEGLLARYGCESPEELNAKLAADDKAMVEASVTPVGVSTTDDPHADPLWFIGPETPYVGLASSTSTFILRGGKPKWHPPIQRIALNSPGPQVWNHCPFYIGDRTDHQNDTNLKIYKEKWHLHTLYRTMAVEAWADERRPAPTTAVVAVEDFKGWDGKAYRPRGVHRPITALDELREQVRLLLQKSETFLDYGNMPDDVRAKFSEQEWARQTRTANPYRNKIRDVAREFKPLPTQAN